MLKKNTLTKQGVSKRSSKPVVWVSALVPAKGADLYNGVRLTVHRSERQAYRDLAEWLIEQGGYNDSVVLDEHKLSDTDPDTKIVDSLNSSLAIRSWNVEKCEVF